MNKKQLITFLIVYLVSSVASYAFFNRTEIGVAPGTSDLTGFAEDEETALGAILNIDPNEVKDQACPLNGQLYTKTERDAWEQRRPLAVMIENSPDARPQSGLEHADVVFEAIAEGGVTRFMAMYYCAAQRYDVTLAPVRSARTYFIDWASGFNKPMYVHVGGANIPGPADALGQINDYGWSLENDINQFSVGYPTFVRNANRLNGKKIATEHTMETTTEKLWDVAEDREWTNMSPELRFGRTTIPSEDWADGYTPWNFAKGDVSGDDPATSVSYDFWENYGQYSVDWEYDSAAKAYKRVMGGEDHMDLNTGNQIMAENVVVLLTQEKGPIDELKHLLYTTIGSGNAVIFRNGTAVDATWSKEDREAQIEFSDRKGDPIEFAPGMIWISVVDTSTDVSY